MTEWQLVRYLLRAPLHPKEERHFGPHSGRYALSIAAALGAFGRFHASLFSSLGTIATPTFDFAADRAEAPAQHLGNLRECLLGFHEAVNLVSFFSAEVLVHQATSTWRLKRP